MRELIGETLLMNILLLPGEETARRVGAEIERVFSNVPLANQVYVSKINPRGVHLI